jgi:hypothetical protein
MAVQRRFLYHGEVVAYAARLDQPRLRDVRGAVALPGTGGRVSLLETSDPGALVRFDYAASSVSGERYGEAYETRATCSIEGLDVCGVLRVDLLSAVLTSSYVHEHAFHEETVTLKGLWADGEYRSTDSQVLTRVRACPTLSKLRAAATEDERLRKSLAAAGTPFDGAGMPRPTAAGDLACHLFDPGNLRFRVESTIYDVFLGEYLIAERQRRLTMLRVEMKPAEGLAAGGEASSLDGTVILLELRINGHTHP